MSRPNHPLKVAILTMPESTASTVYGMYDLFASAGRDWELLVEGKSGLAKFQPL